MDTLWSLLSAFQGKSISIKEFSEQFIDYWNDVRVEQNKAIDAAGIRDELDDLWSKYKAGEMNEVTYGMQWTELLARLPEDIRIPPHSIVYSLGNELYSILIMYQESEHLDTAEIPTIESIQEDCQILLDAIDT